MGFVLRCFGGKRAVKIKVLKVAKAILEAPHEFEYELNETIRQKLVF